MIVVDSSAVVAIFLDEPDAADLLKLIEAVVRPRISAATVIETLIVLDGRRGTNNEQRLRSFLAETDLAIEPVTSAQAWAAGAAYRQFGKGRHRAALNYGDCFAYALARHLDLPLLFKGDDFGHTDIRPAR